MTKITERQRIAKAREQLKSWRTKDFFDKTIDDLIKLYSYDLQAALDEEKRIAITRAQFKSPKQRKIFDEALKQLLKLNVDLKTALIRASACAHGCCFVAGTKVTLKDGSYIDIEKVQPGDEVLSYDEEKKIFFISPVAKVQHHGTELQRLHHFTLGDILLTSNDIHPIFVQNLDRYVLASEINDLFKQQERILLRTEKDSLIPVSRIDVEEKSVPVFNLHVEGVNDDHPQWHGVGHNYFANGVLVHNKPII